MNKMAAIALDYAEYGWLVFPIHTPTGDAAKPCSCRRVTCPQIGEHPCHKNTCKDSFSVFRYKPAGEGAFR
jgi:hypothetical protein